MTEFHELFDREEELKGSSDRSFGIVFSVFCLVVAGVRAWHGNAWAFAWFALAAGFSTAAFARSALLSPLNRAWTRLGLSLYRVVNPVVLGLLFYGCVLPVGLVMRLKGNDLLREKKDVTTASYWIARVPPGPAPESIKRQF